jgi:hypothetical protein
VVKSLSESVWAWEQVAFQDAEGKPLINAGVVSQLHRKIKAFGKDEISINFWLVPRVQNKEADCLANAAQVIPPKSLYVYRISPHPNGEINSVVTMLILYRPAMTECTPSNSLQISAKQFWKRKAHTSLAPRKLACLLSIDLPLPTDNDASDTYKYEDLYPIQ